MEEKTTPQNPLLRISGVKASQNQHNTSSENPIQANTPEIDRDDDDYNWRDEAACKGMSSMMFPRYLKDISYISAARKLCKGCPVKEPCLDYALTFPPTDLHGVWAGLSPRQIAAEQQRRGITETKPTIAAIWTEFDKIDKKNRPPDDD
jgi:WhiB family redox-sensing transcriptional regulator